MQRFKDILKRIEKLEARYNANDRVVLVFLENGEEYKKNLSVHKASMLALKQNTAYLFGVSDIEDKCRIVRVESGDDDGFISALIEADEIDIEEVEGFIEV